MDGAAGFLRALGHALELRLRAADATVRLTAEELLTRRASELVEENPAPVFHFTAAGVRYGALPLAGFEEWPWARSLAARGIVRVELVGPPAAAALAGFLDVAAGRIPGDAPIPRDGIRWGAVEFDLPVANDDYPLDEALTVVRQLFRTAGRGEPLPRGDVAAIVAALNCVLAGEYGAPLPILRVGSREGYQPAHALNTALLAMAVADALRLGADERRECGVAALLHDIGMTRLPAPGETDRFTTQDRARVRGHPLEGARLLLRQGDTLEGAAVVSYEHHLRQDGSGYPRLSYPREPHLLSRIVAVVDAFDALLAPRQDRGGFEPTDALREVERSAVTHFDPRIVGAFSEAVVRAASRGELLLTLRPN
jgi:HD-GYP domain-containing protein (c-di-GMP phosphodiesterase class II)